MKLLLLSFTLLSLACQKHSTNKVAPSKEKKPSVSVKETLDFQIGNEWSRKLVTENDPNFELFARTVGKLVKGTAFYLGEFNGKHLVASNSHVVDGTDETFFRPCHSIPNIVLTHTYFELTLIGEKFLCTKILGDWPVIDFAIMQIEEFDGSNFNSLMSTNISTEIPQKGDDLILGGHGIHLNKDRKLEYTDDEFCKVFSSAEKLAADPLDETVFVYSFLHGCEGSYGDSGSPIFNRNTKEIVGTLWTGAVYKDLRMGNDDYVRDIFENNEAEAWKQVTYGTSFDAITREIKIWLKKQDDSDQNIQAIESFIQHIDQ